MAEAVSSGANALPNVPAPSLHPTLTLLSHLGDMHARTLHVCVKVLLSPVACVCRPRYNMPRKQGGIGRTGSKHKKATKFDIHRKPKQDQGPDGPFFTSELPDTTNAKENVADQSGVDNLTNLVSDCAVADEAAGDASKPPNRPQVERPRHPRYFDGQPFLPGFRHPGGTHDVMWDPDKPPCIPSDERPLKLFGSEEAAEAAAAAGRLEQQLGDDGYEKTLEDDEREEMARVRYKYALLRLAAAFPEFEVPVAELCAGLNASEQQTRPCPCGVGQLPRWPWVVQTARLGFCPGCWDEVDGSYEEHCSFEMVHWRNEWIDAWPGCKNISW